MSGNAELAGFPQFSNILYTHNVSESGNAMRKNCTGFKESDLKELVTREDDIVRALIGLDSLYEVLEEFCHLVSKNADHLITLTYPNWKGKRERQSCKTRTSPSS